MGQAISLLKPTTVMGKQVTTAYTPSTSEMSGGGVSSGMGSISSGVISGLSDIATGFINASRAENTYNFNASMAKLQGRMRRLSANVEIRNIRKKAQTLFSSQRAAYVNAGVKMTGSSAEVMASSLRESELDAIYTGISADYNVSLQNTQAGMYEMAGEQEGYNALQNTYKSILNMGTKYYQRG